MKPGFILFFISALMFSCLHHKTAVNKSNNASIHKLWSFEKYEIVNFDKYKGLFFGTDEKLRFLDLTKPDSLVFIDSLKKKIFRYSIKGNNIVMKTTSKPAKFRIWKLTHDELILLLPDDGLDDKSKPDNAIGMHFKTK